MCAAAIYLDHHWVIDVIVGLLYGLIAFATLRMAIPLRRPVALVAGDTPVVEPVSK